MGTRRGRVTARGSGVQFDFTYNNVRCRETLPFPPTKKGIKAAEEKMDLIQIEIAMGTFDFAKHFPNSRKAISLSSNPGNHTTVKAALETWLKDSEKRCARSTYLDYSVRTYKHLINPFGHLSITELNARDVKEWIRTSTISNKSIRNVLIPLFGIMKDAADEGIIERNPLSNIKLPPITTREAQPFSEVEVDAILAQLDGQVKNFYQFAFETGLRTSEQIALNWNDVDIERRTVFVERAKVCGQLKQPKTSSGRRNVELSKGAIEALKSQQFLTGGIGTVFRDPRYGQDWKSDQALRRCYWYPALERAGVEKRNPYQARHTFASRKLTEGANPAYIAQQMGHSDWGMIRRVYAKWIPTH